MQTPAISTGRAISSAALEQQRDELDAQREEAIADGRWEDVQRITADLEAVKRTIALMKKTPG
jgi:hypothetical protein